ncbi:hypothetical protein A3F64_02740 [Candidatus Saccharibacteria bacterium RIFCSPHIGHO2_12_FULL_42_8]|nr:MAG: hypothetical protein A3F64_02740 [Candidatus Saccharibacteria bacterium RIFCSPHIGHO2_12_FULL_42_8]
MKITKIQPAIKVAGRYNIFVDEKYSFSLDETQLLDQKLKTGFEISPEKLDELKGESEFGKSYARALELILRRPRSIREINDYARRKKWEIELRDRVIEKLSEKGYLDDTKFASFWLKARVNSKPISKRKLNAELLQKGIKREIIDEVLVEYTEVNEQDALAALIKKKRNKYTDDQKLMAYLANQGFSYGAIKEALQDLG